MMIGESRDELWDRMALFLGKHNQKVFLQK